MLGQILRSLFRDEVRAIQRKSAGIGLELQGAIVLLGAVLFATLALFLWLAEGRPAWQAALIVAALLAVIGAGLIVAGREMLRRRAAAARRRRPAEPDLFGLLSGKKPGPDTSQEEPAPPGIVTSALIAGIMIGRFLRR